MRPISIYQSSSTARPCSDTVYNLVLTANVESHVTVPTWAKFVVISATANTYIKAGASSVTATVPSGDITDGTGSDLNPSGYQLYPADVRISCISGASSIVSLAFYSGN